MKVQPEKIRDQNGPVLPCLRKFQFKTARVLRKYETKTANSGQALENLRPRSPVWPNLEKSETKTAQSSKAWGNP